MATNGYQSFQDALNTTQYTFSGGGKIVLPPGLWLFDTSAILPQNISGIDIEGSGWGTILKLGNGVNDYLLKGHPSSNVPIQGFRLANLKIDCNGTNQSANSGGVYIPGLTYARFEHVWFENMYQYGLHLEGDNL